MTALDVEAAVIGLVYAAGVEALPRLTTRERDAVVALAEVYRVLVLFLPETWLPTESGRRRALLGRLPEWKRWALALRRLRSRPGS